MASTNALATTAPASVDPPLDDDADESDVEDVVGNGVEALVWRSMLGPGCGVYFKKRMNQDGGDTFMPLNEVLFRLEHLLVFD